MRPCRKSRRPTARSAGARSLDGRAARVRRARLRRRDRRPCSSARPASPAARSSATSRSSRSLLRARAGRPGQADRRSGSSEGCEGVVRHIVEEDPEWLGVYLERRGCSAPILQLRERWRTLNPEGQAALDARYRHLQAAGAIRGRRSLDTLGRFLGIVLRRDRRAAGGALRRPDRRRRHARALRVSARAEVASASVQTVLFVGAGRHQRRAILRAKELGLRVAAVDRNPDAPGLAEADIAKVVDFADVDGGAEGDRAASSSTAC